MPHDTKNLIFLRVILGSQATGRHKVNEVQLRFRSGRETGEGIFRFNITVEKHIAVMKDMYVSFIHYAKAFDRVKHENLIGCLKQIGLGGKDV